MLNLMDVAGKTFWVYETWRAYQGQADERTYALAVHDDLLHDLNRAVRGVYEKLGDAISDRFAAVPAPEDQKQRQFRTPNRYSLADFHLDPEQIRKDFAFVFERFDFDARRRVDP